MNRANIEVLRGSLKPNIEYVITVPLNPEQEELYRRYIKALFGGGQTKDASQTTIFGWLAVLTLLTNHPWCFRQKLLAPPPPRRPKKGEPAQVAVANEAKSPDNTSNDTDAGANIPSHAGTAKTEGEKDIPYDETLQALLINNEMIQQILDGFPDKTSPAFFIQSDRIP